MGRTWCQKDPAFRYEGQTIHARIGFDAEARKKLEAVTLTLTVPNVARLEIPEGQADGKMFGAPLHIETKEGKYGAALMIEAGDAAGLATLDVRAAGDGTQANGGWPAMFGAGEIGETIKAEPIETE